MAQHQQRVAMHKAYDAAFCQVLARGRAVVSELYPLVVAAATKRFSAISLQVRAAAKVLGDRGQEAAEAASLVKRVQALEKEKLTRVAASHLDRVRALARHLGPDPGPGPAAADGAATRRKIAELSVEIEETVSELRHELADLREA